MGLEVKFGGYVAVDVKADGLLYDPELSGLSAESIYDLLLNNIKKYEKLNTFREESLSNKLATGNKNPVGILAILNRHYQWNMPGVSREQANKSALTAAELPQLGTPQTPQIQGIVDNGGDNTV